MHFLIVGSPGAAIILDGYGLLGSDVLLVHHNNISEEDHNLLRGSGAHIASTPSTEIQMSQGDPVCFHPGMHQFSSIGVDLSTVSGASIPAQMMLGLQYARGRRNATFEQLEKWPKGIYPTCEQAYNLGTIMGARAIGKEHEIGSLVEGKRADIVIFKGDSLGMLTAGPRNPVGAIVLNSTPQDIESVIVDGEFRKVNGQLQDVAEQVDDNFDHIKESRRIGWSDIVREIGLSSRSIEQERARKCDHQTAVEGVINAFYMNRQGMAESI
jgi:cytosine/adenosine deaminase-related metal-dependent hydrolase